MRGRRGPQVWQGAQACRHSGTRPGCVDHQARSSPPKQAAQHGVWTAGRLACGTVRRPVTWPIASCTLLPSASWSSSTTCSSAGAAGWEAPLRLLQHGAAACRPAAARAELCTAGAMSLGRSEACSTARPPPQLHGEHDGAGHASCCTTGPNSLHSTHALRQSPPSPSRGPHLGADAQPLEQALHLGAVCTGSGRAGMGEGMRFSRGARAGAPSVALIHAALAAADRILLPTAVGAMLPWFRGVHWHEGSRPLLPVALPAPIGERQLAWRHEQPSPAAHRGSTSSRRQSPGSPPPCRSPCPRNQCPKTWRARWLRCGGALQGGEQGRLAGGVRQMVKDSAATRTTPACSCLPLIPKWAG